jgi:hypothetical protein
MNQRSPTVQAVAQRAKPGAAHELGDEFMSAADLRAVLGEPWHQRTS